MGKSGNALRSIGKTGGRPLLGPWDNAGMRFITGITVDVKGDLWVMEHDDKPRRISVWNAATGAFVREFFGPTHYGPVAAPSTPPTPTQ